MAAIPAKTMLQKLLTAGTLSAKDREVFEGMWDAVHRYGKLSKKQIAWVESAFYEMDKNPATNAPKRSPKVGFVVSSRVTSVQKARSIDRFKEICPNATPELQAKVKTFFASGGEVFEVRPKT